MPRDVAGLCERAIELSGMKAVNRFSHRFEPQGETVLFVLAESHFSAHTYPESKYMSIDCYTCGDEGCPMAAVLYIINAVKTRDCRLRVMGRGEAAA